MRQSTRTESHQLNDVGFAVGYDLGGVLQLGRGGEPPMPDKGKKGGETPALCDLHEKQAGGGRRALSWLSSPFSPLQTPDPRDPVMEINAHWHWNKFNTHTHTHRV